MKVQVVDLNSHIEYQVEELPKQLTDQFSRVLLHYGFSQREDKYVKLYDKKTFMFSQEIGLLKGNFESCLEKMINNTLGSTSMDWEGALEAVSEKMLEHNIKWWLTGSAACTVRGINITPQDLDVMTYKTEIKKIEKAFKDFVIEPYTHVTGWVVKGFGVIYLKGRIDMAFDPEESADDYTRSDFGIYAMNNLETVKWKGYDIKVPPVHLHIHSNKVRNRNERVRLIEEHIEYLNSKRQ